MISLGDTKRMIKDRYGNSLFAENTITVFDTSLNYDSELFENTVGWKLKNFNRELFGAAYEIDVGAGADWPTVAYEVLDKYIPFSPIAAAFFLGDRIEKSALAWKRMGSALLSCFQKESFTDANGAELLALKTIFEQTSYTEVKLLAFTWLDEEVMLFDTTDKANATFEVVAKLDRIEPRDQQFRHGLHSPPTFLFKFDAQGKIILAKINRKDVELIEL